MSGAYQCNYTSVYRAAGAEAGGGLRSNISETRARYGERETMVGQRYAVRGDEVYSVPGWREGEAVEENGGEADRAGWQRGDEG